MSKIHDYIQNIEDAVGKFFDDIKEEFTNTDSSDQDSNTNTSAAVAESQLKAKVSSGLKQVADKVNQMNIGATSNFTVTHLDSDGNPVTSNTNSRTTSENNNATYTLGNDKPIHQLDAITGRPIYANVDTLGTRSQSGATINSVDQDGLALKSQDVSKNTNAAGLKENDYSYESDADKAKNQTPKDLTSATDPAGPVVTPAELADDSEDKEDKDDEVKSF